MRTSGHVFTLLILITTLTFFLNSCAPQEPLIEEIIQPLASINTSEQEIHELTPEEYTIEVQQDFIQKQSIRVTLEEFTLKEDGAGGYDYHFTIKAEDTIQDEQKSKDTGNFYLRNPLLWFGNLYNQRNNVKELFLCDFTQHDNTWYTTYCINNQDLDKNFFGQKTRFIYTTLKHNTIKDETLRTLTTKEQTYVFDIIIPEEYYRAP